MSLQKDKSLKKIKIVKKGYDIIADAYYRDRDLFSNMHELREFHNLLPPSARVLDVGCGGGLPVSKFLSENNCDLIGIDISKKNDRTGSGKCTNGQIYKNECDRT